MTQKASNNASKKSVNKLVNMIPGALIYKGNKAEKFTIEYYTFNQEREFHGVSEVFDEKFLSAIDKPNKSMIQWINVTGISNVDEIKKVGSHFHIDEMILEQILNVSKHSFYKVTEDYIYTNIQMMQTVNGKFNNENISLYLCNNTILTFQERKGDVFGPIRDRIKNNQGHIRNKSIEYTYFCLLDAILDHYIFSLDDMKMIIEEMDLMLMENQSLDSQKLHQLRRQIVLIRMSINPMDKLITDLLHCKGEGFINNIVYFESLSQHTKMVVNEVNVQKETIDGLYENYMITNANDMNQIMTILTVFSAVFIPLSFLAGVFGMNFSFIPGLKNINGFYYFIIGCVLMAGMMIFYFKKKKWF